MSRVAWRSLMARCWAVDCPHFVARLPGLWLSACTLMSKL